jgi:hypothetical protein
MATGNHRESEYRKRQQACCSKNSHSAYISSLKPMKIPTASDVKVINSVENEQGHQ